jgi:hypothetical protein
MTQHNPIVISSGHGKYVRGAAGYLDEVNEARKVVDRVGLLLREAGIDVKTFHDNTSHDVNTNLNTIVNYHNAQTRQLDVSVHFNAYQTTSSPMGVECLYVTQSSLAGEVSRAIADAGAFKDRGPKKRTDLAFLNGTEEPAILIETCFVDSKADADLYHEHFDAICYAIAEAIAGRSIDEKPVEPPDEIEPPDPAPEGAPVVTVTLTADKPVRVMVVAGENVSFGDAPPDPEPPKPPYDPSGLPPMFSDAQVAEITSTAINHPIADYSWRDRGQAPDGFVKGFAVAYAQACVRFHGGDPIAHEMAKANTHNDALDALSWYNSNFAAIGLDNDEDGIDTMRHLFVLLMGLGMRESSGQHCCGRDQSASNTSSDTAEAGLYQTSWNAHTCSDQFDALADQYDTASPQGYMPIFAEGVSCSSSDWASYGSGDGYRFQEVCKWSPAYAVETCAITLRNLRQHYGPINRKEAELRREADDMLWRVQSLVDKFLELGRKAVA